MTNIFLQASITGTSSSDTAIVPNANWTNNPLYVDLGDGSSDSLYIEENSLTCYVSSVESISAGSGNVNLIFQTKALSPEITQNPYAYNVNLGTGYDTLTLGNFTNMLTVAGVELIKGGTGSDSVYLSDSSNTVFDNVEIIVGSSYNDTISLTSQFLSSISLTTSINLGSGNDSLTLGNFTNKGTVTGVESLIGGNLIDSITFRDFSLNSVIKDIENLYLQQALNNNNFKFQGGESILYLSSYNNNLVVSGASQIRGDSGIDTVTFYGDNITTLVNIENIIGGIGSDNISLADTFNSKKINLGNGFDTLNLSYSNQTNNVGFVAGVEVLNGSYGFDEVTLLSSSTMKISSIEKLTGSSGNDSLTFETSYKNSLNLDKGTDTVILNGIDNSINLFNVESLIGGNGQDIIVCKTALVNSNFDFKDGSDSLYLGNFAKNTSYVSNAELVIGNLGYDTINFYGDNVTTVTSVESILGGIGSDNITLKDQLTNKLTINLGNGFDTLSLGNYINVGKVSGVEVINGGNDKDYITLTGTANTVTINDIEFVTGSEGKDTVTSNTILSGTIDLGGGIDKLVLNGEGNSVNISNIELLAGSTKIDSIAVKTQLTEGIFDLKGGTDTVKLGDFTNSATFFNTEKIITGSLNDVITLGNKLTSEIISYSNGNDSIINFDMTKDKIDITNSGTISFNQTNKTILDGSTLIGSYNDSTADLILHFNSINTNVTLTGIDTLSTTNFII